MTPDSLTVLDDLVKTVVVELYAAYGVTTTFAGATDPTALPKSAEIAGMIGFSGGELRGTILLASTEALFTRTTPAAARGDVRAWAAELTNQLLGRLKNRLYRHGVLLTASTPTALSGVGLAVAAPTTQHALGYAFHEPAADVWVRVDIIAESTDLTKTRDDGAEALREGHVVLF